MKSQKHLYYRLGLVYHMAKALDMPHFGGLELRLSEFHLYPLAFSVPFPVTTKLNIRWIVPSCAAPKMPWIFEGNARTRFVVVKF